MMKTFILENFGCQMNVADADEVKNSLIESGYKESNFSPDLVILNTCAVRGSAEERIFGRLSYYQTLKKQKPFTLVLMGCVAQKEKEKIFDRSPFVDLVVGTHQKSQLANILSSYESGETQQVFGDFQDFQFKPAIPSSKYPFKSDIVIIHGCNKFCTYCIVPYTRGRELSKSSEDIINDAKRLVDQGVSEMLLLGQNVNSYGQDTGDISFAELLHKLAGLDGLKRIRFLTSHPKDFTMDLVDVIAESDKVCNYVHLPLQSASDKVLSKMKRDYTFEHYLNIVTELKRRVSKIVLSTDILVGFPYEEEADFEATLNAVKLIRFDEAFMFKYSVRTGTKSAMYPDKVDETEKKKRLQLIIDTQLEITKEKNIESLGRVEEVLLESVSKNNPNELMARTESNKPVIVPLPDTEIGTYRTVKLKGLKGNTFRGELVDSLELV